MRAFIFGAGFSGRVFARRRIAAGWSVAATARSDASLDALRADGIEAHRFDGEAPLDASGLAALRDATHVLNSVPPGDAGDPVLNHHGADLADHRGLAWVGYLSTTGVYGDTGGAWVDETAPRNPSSGRSRRRVEAEDKWLALCKQQVPTHVFRLAGIYGPGRNALVQLRSGRARRIDKPGHLFSRIHVEDIARVLEASIDRPNPGAAYNVCDDEPAENQEVVAFAAGLLGMEPPPLVPIEEAEMSPMGRSFFADRRRVRNDRIKDELGVALAYPDYRRGLTALLEIDG